MREALLLLLFSLAFLFLPVHTHAGEKAVDRARKKANAITIRHLSAPVAIDTIVVVGNRTTKRFVILQEIDISPGEMVRSQDMERNRKRLESLRLFSHATMRLGTLENGKKALVILVDELWYIWPGLFLSVDEDDPERVDYGLILTHENFRGRRENLTLNARYGISTGFLVNWSLPYVSQAHPEWSMRVRVRAMREEEPSFLRDRENVESEEIAGQLSLGHRLDIERSVQGGVEVMSRKFSTFNGRPDTLDFITYSKDNHDLLMVTEIGYDIDFRHYKPWPSQGYVVSFKSIQSFSLDGQQISYWQPKIFGTHFYSPTERVHFVTGTKLDLQIGQVPTYRRLLLDREAGFRTSTRRSLEGTRRAIGWTELRLDIVPITYITINTFDFIQRYTSNLRFGISMTLFQESGAVGGDISPSAPGDDFLQTSGWEMGYGAGLVFHVPYQDMVRLEVIRSARYPSEGFYFRLRVGVPY